jgi:hypothetical protein
MNSTLNQQPLPGATDNDDTQQHHGTRVLLNPDADATTAGTFDLYFMVMMSILFLSFCFSLQNSIKISIHASEYFRLFST